MNGSGGSSAIATEQSGPTPTGQGFHTSPREPTVVVGESQERYCVTRVANIAAFAVSAIATDRLLGQCYSTGCRGRYRINQDSVGAIATVGSGGTMTTNTAMNIDISRCVA